MKCETCQSAIDHLTAALEASRKESQFLRSHRPIARRLTEVTAERDAAVAEVARVKASVGAIHYAVRTGFSAKAILVECVEAAPELAAIDAARSEDE